MSFLSALFGSSTKNSDFIKILDAEDYKSHISKNKVQLVDVRTPREYGAGHIKGAINIDYFQQGSFKSKLNQLDKNKPVYLYCRSGNRSQNAAKILVDLGFQEIYDLKGGYMRWS